MVIGIRAALENELRLIGRLGIDSVEMGGRLSDDNEKSPRTSI